MHIKTFRLLLIGLGFTAFLSCSRPPSPSRQNHSFEYQAVSAVQHDYRQEGDSLHIFLKYADVNYFKFPKNLRASYAVYLNYEKPDIILSDSIALNNRQLQILPNAVYLNFKVPLAKLGYPAMLLAKVTPADDPKNAIRHDIALSSGLVKPYILTDSATGFPLFQNYVVRNQAFFIDQNGVELPGELKRYEASFSAALPPMARPDNKVPASIKKLQTISFLDNPIYLTEPGLYGVEIGGKQVGGLFVESSGSFPELTTAQDLIQPLIYLTSSEERRKLYEAKEPKAAVDKFWLDISVNQNVARKLIRTYYERVADANRFFSAHKAGWLTDRGMIYLVFGPPDVVNRFTDREEWNYFSNQNHNEVRFVFSKKDNTFTQNHYELVRSAYLESIWYNMVEQWRSGTIAN
jgi:GWxTD domain-containing protein